uniref:Serpin family I member 2 n=1 Tax=Leptobrachium leishanense TaxID=445787 RepID=A0A8C5PJY9_9ANUR
MTSSYVVLFVVTALSGISITCGSLSPPGDTVIDFTTDLHRAIQLADTGENIIFSPLGVSLILGMIKLGAGGTTLQQIKRALKLQGNQESEEFPGLQPLLAVISEENKEFTFNLVNALYLQEGFRVKEKYLHSNKKFFKSAIKSVNFQDAKASAETISAWVEMQTNGKIQKLLSSDDISPLTKMILVNAIYFKGDWKHKFTRESTRMEEFKIKRGVTTKIPMMHLLTKTQLGYFSTNNLSYKVLELPYKGNQISLILALPAKNADIGDMEKLMTEKLIKGWFTEMTEEEVEISLPRFKLEHEVDLKKSLLSLNVTDIFNQKCDLSGITGMEAAAMSMTNHNFVADHPFLFFIRHVKSESILFMGKVTNPDESNAKRRDVESL